MTNAKKQFLRKKLDYLEYTMHIIKRIRDQIHTVNHDENDEIESYLDDVVFRLTEVEGSLNETCYAIHRATRYI